ncbi:hypothetical protein CA13_59650 [Planctomycetes bacterium CA13]|uniref:Uncharacterized protein n=1 Tax=Novipirellula herctigrandis TaxID=2527986 RepID=A0A5C5ZBH1_9BACT|nr:hypothetical protein CA13_59650 [Planctomycetes bacterium CA13]
MDFLMDLQKKRIRRESLAKDIPGFIHTRFRRTGFAKWPKPLTSLAL